MKVQTMKNWFARVGSVAVLGTICGAIGGLGGYAALSYAAGENLGGVTDHHIPYQGMLELGGEPVDGPMDFVFTIYKSKDSVKAVDKLWTSNTHNLQVSRGYFATVLGDETDIDKRIPPAVMNEKVLYIGMNVDGVELAGRQRILAVPYAQNGMPGKNFAVDGRIQTTDLAVTKDATVNGKLNVLGTSTLGGGVVGGLDVAGGTTLSGGAIVNSGLNVNSGSLTVNSTSHLKSGVRVDGNLTTGGTAGTDKLIQFRNIWVLNTKNQFPLTANITGFNTTDWNCAIGSFKINGDINEDNAHTPLLEVKTHRNGTQWQVRVNMAHDSKGDDKGFDVGVVCYSTKISHMGGWF